MSLPNVDPDAPLLFVINAGAGRQPAGGAGDVLLAALKVSGGSGELLPAEPDCLRAVADQAASRALREGGAVVAVGGDGTINTVAQATHAQGCAMGVVAQGTFNYFARCHGLPTEPVAAVEALRYSSLQPVQVGTVNGHVFLVNASMGLYPELLEDREVWKGRFGRSRLVAFGAAIATLLAEHRRLRLSVTLEGVQRDVRTQTLFVANNRLQLEQVGAAHAQAPEQGRLAALMLKPVGSIALLGLMMRGALGTLGDAETVDGFEFEAMRVKTWLPRGQRAVKVACDGEVIWLSSPLTFSVSPRPLYLLKPAAADAGRLAA